MLSWEVRMGTKKKLVLPEEIPFLETDYDLDVTIEIVESDSYDARLDEFVKLVAKAVSKWLPLAEKHFKEQGKDSFFFEYFKIRQELLKAGELKLLIDKVKMAQEAEEKHERALSGIAKLKLELITKMRMFEETQFKRNPRLEADLDRTISKLERKIARLAKDLGIEEPSDERHGDDS